MRGQILTAFTGLLATALAQHSVNFITTAIHCIGCGDLWTLPFDDTLTGSIVTVNPSGTVVELNCPITENTDKLGMEDCSFYESWSYTLRPTGTEYQDITTTDFTSGTELAISSHNACTPLNDNLVCNMTGAVTASVGNNRDTTTYMTTITYTDVTPWPVLITAGVEKAGPIPESGSASMVSKLNFLGAVAAAIIVATVLKL